MITVKIKNEKNEVKQILFSGHALYEDFGKDIVCAGASAILTTSVNAILKYDKNALKYTIEDDVLVKILKTDKIINLLIDNMIDLLKELSNDYPKNIIVREDEENE